MANRSSANARRSVSNWAVAIATLELDPAQGETVIQDLRLAGATPDGRKWRMRHRILRSGELAATVEVDGAWLDLSAAEATSEDAAAALLATDA